MSYKLNGLLAKDAEPYSHADHVDASVTLDVGPILREAIDALPYPPPQGANPTTLDRRVRQLLAEAGIVRFTEADYRRFLKRAIRELSDARDSNIAHRKASMDPNTPSGRAELARRADELLAAQGEYDPDADAYAAALDQVLAELTAADSGPVYEGSETREEIDVVAKQILFANRNHDPSEADYLRACTEAARRLGISLDARRP